MDSAIIATISAVVVAVITQAGAWFRDRANNKDNRKGVSIDALRAHNVEQDADIAAIKEATMLNCMDRISFVAERYIERGYIDRFYRKWLNDCHSVYHNKLGGNGDLDAIMERVNALPLRKED